MNFWSNLDTPIDFFAFFLVLMVTFVNGFTDAPNSIHSSIRAGTLSLLQASFLSGIFNFLGVFFSSFITFSVGKSVEAIASIKSSDDGGVVACSCLLTVIIVGVIAWLLKMPSSESHALLFSLAGASICLSKSVGSSLGNIIYIVFSMIISSFVTYILSRLFTKHICARASIKGGYLVASCCALSFMHGAQDGQKLLAILLILQGTNAEFNAPPIFLVLIVSTIMCISTILSGKRILSSIDKLSENSDTSRVFFADLSAFSVLTLCSALGMPISTGTIKSASVYGTEISPSKESKRVIMRIFLTSLITLPISFLLGLLICKIFLLFVY